MSEIINRVAKSPLITIDLEEFYPEGKRMHIDLAEWLFEGLILREKDFREALKNHDWSAYQNAYVTMSCSTDAILPGWSYLLLNTYLQPFAKKIVLGNEAELNRVLYQEIIAEMDIKPFHNKKVILKGCSQKPVPENAYIHLAERLLPVVNSLMFGEACSTVPLYKKKVASQSK